MNSNYNGLKYSVFIYPVVSRFISSMEVQGNLYFNVERYEFDSPSPAISVIYYWAKGVGIIKRQVKTSGTIKTELLTRRG